MRGSWWSHPKAQVIFQVNELLEDHPDVLITKLISGKVTFVHRALWPEVFAVGNAHDAWQLKGLSKAAKDLLEIVEAKDSVRTDSLVTSNKAKVGDAARELEKRLLVVANQVHTETGAHAKVLERWGHWRRRVKLRKRKIAALEGMKCLEDRLTRINAEYHAKASLPWQ